MNDPATYFEIDPIAQLLKRLSKKSTEILSCDMIVADDLKWFKFTSKKYRSELRGLAKYSKMGKKKAVKIRMDLALNSYAGKIVAVAHTILADKYEGVVPKELTRAKLEKLTKIIDLYAPLKGAAHLVRISNFDGTYRPTLNFSGNIRSCQLLVSNILIALGYMSAIDCNASGLGAKKAVKLIRGQIEDGYGHWLSFDLSKCFRSIKCNHISWVELPRKVMTHCVFVNEYCKIISHTQCEQEVKEARQGLPLGAKLSGILASALIERKLRPFVGDKCWVISYADDVIIGARDPAILTGLAPVVKDNFENDPAGPLGFKRFSIDRPEEGLCFLGYYIKSIPSDDQIKTYAHPNRDARRKFRYKCFDILKMKYSNLSYDEQADIIFDKAERWRRSFSAAPPSNAQIEEVKTWALQHVSDCGTISELSHKPLLTAKIANKFLS